MEMSSAKMAVCSSRDLVVCAMTSTEVLSGKREDTWLTADTLKMYSVRSARPLMLIDPELYVTYVKQLSQTTSTFNKTSIEIR